MEIPNKQKTYQGLIGFLSIIGISIVLIIYIVQIFYSILPHDLFIKNIQYHSAIEMLGASIALIMSVILFVTVRNKDLNPLYFWPAVSLASMGLLDFFHSLVLPGNSFVWLHSFATLSGGFFLIFIWMREKRQTSINFPLVYISIFFFSLWIGILSFFPSVSFPEMLINNEFTLTAKLLNLVGGCLFFLSSVFFFRRFYFKRHYYDFVFGQHALLFGAAGILFDNSMLWDVHWWIWHGIRFIAYFIILLFLIEFINKNIKRQKEYSQNLEKEVLARTNDLTLALDSTLAGIIMIQGEKTIYANPQMSIILGYSNNEILEMGPMSLIHPLDRELVTQRHHDRLEGKSVPSNYEVRCLTKEGQIRWITILAKLIAIHGVPTIITTIIDITGKKEKEIQLQNILDNTLSGIFLTREGRFVYINPQVNRITGFKENDLINKDFLSLVHPDDKADIKKRVFEKQWSEAVIETFETRMIDSNGHKIWVNLQVSTMIQEDQKTRLWTMVDITEQKISQLIQQESEHALAVSEKNLVEAQKIAHLGSWEITLETHAFKLSDQFYLIHGLTPGEGIDSTKSYLNYIFPEDIEYYKDSIKKLMIEDKITFAYRILKQDGEIRYLQLKGRVHRNKEGQIERTVGTTLDITELKRAEKELIKTHDMLEQRVEERTKELKSLTEQLKAEIHNHRETEKSLVESKENLQSVLDNLPDVYYRTDMTGIIQNISPACLEAIGYKPEEMIGRPMAEFYVNSDERAKVAQAIIDGGGRATQVEAAMFNKKGETVWVSTNAIIRLDSEGKPIFAEGIARNITRKKNMEDELRQSKIDADLANNAKSQFLASMSHEIRTPLNAILGFSDLMTPMVTEPQAKNHLDAVKTSSSNLLFLINDILDFSKIEAGKLKVYQEYTSLIQIINEIKTIFSLEIEKKGLEFIISHNLSNNEFFFLDELRVRQVLINLISNAIKFTSKGTIEFKVQKKENQSKNKNCELILSVKDSGIGIPKKEQKNIFEVFQQQEGQDTKKFGGTGLGLSICKELAKIMNGSITVKSSPGKGSTFSLSLNSVTFKMGAKSFREELEINYDNIKFNNETILITDDSKLNRTLIMEFLKNHNLRFLEAENGQEALHIITKNPVDLIILDEHMPLMSGYELMKNLKKNKKYTEIPIIILTGIEPGEKHNVRKKFDNKRVLTKPLQVAELYKELCMLFPFSRLKEPKSKPLEEPLFIFSKDDKKENLTHVFTTLQNQYMQDWNNVNQSNEFEQISNFAEKIKKLGEEYQIGAVITYGQNLLISSQTFNIQKISFNMNNYPDFVKEIQTYIEGS